jgi:hypothetical protein
MESEVWLHSFLAWTRDGGEWSALRPYTTSPRVCVCVCPVCHSDVEKSRGWIAICSKVPRTLKGASRLLDVLSNCLLFDEVYETEKWGVDKPPNVLTFITIF